MKKIYRWIAGHPKTIFGIFAVLFIAGIICKGFISVNYDMNDYLPSDSSSTVAIEKMNEEFGTGIPNARIMIKNVSVTEALEYKKQIKNITGVDDVMWLDDAADVTQPIEFIDSNTLETYYKDNTALFSVTLDDDNYMTACDEIREIIGDDNCMSGSAVMKAVATNSTVTEIPIIAVFAVLFALVVLLFTTNAWIEPLVVLLGLGVAVIINAGSNLMFGEISFVTNAAGSILQLAVSLDYSVFLLHRYEEYKTKFSSHKEAMVEAVSSSASSILSSGLTTVIGFLALCLMRYRIGPDLGLALAKGVAISLLTVFTLMPALILSFDKLIEKTKHKPFLHTSKNFGKIVCKAMIPILCVFLVIIAPAYLASNSNEFYYGASHIFGAETKLGSDIAEIEDTFGKTDTYVLMLPKTSKATEKELSRDLNEITGVKSIVSYVDSVGESVPEAYLDADTLSLLNSEHYTRMVISVNVDYEGEAASALIKSIRSTAQEYYPNEWYLAGEGVSTLDLKETITDDMAKVNLIAIGAVFIVLLFSMKSISLPIFLVLGIETAIWINLSIPYFTDSIIFYIAYLIISSVQLGATVDYAILLTDRYLEYRKTMEKNNAIIEVISNCTISVLTSASVLCVVGFLLGKISSHGILAQLGMFLGKGTLCSLAIVLFVLPGMLFVFDGLIQKTTLGTHFLKKEKTK